ncbi:hypothetical protein SASPL_106681 [Salvia splendens]|uniref:ATP-binding cassette, subfamily B (MDR/TAP), member 1 n=1 Tax=Salvia splendens TaxID=180675 RepID=A0A8X9A9T6_SALSN|nr:hypothetical protein SASPL_106681 [Salvia splendens]
MTNLRQALYSGIILMPTVFYLYSTSLITSMKTNSYEPAFFAAILRNELAWFEKPQNIVGSDQLHHSQHQSQLENGPSCLGRDALPLYRWADSSQVCKSNAAYSELVSLASESTSNIKTVASFCLEDHVLEKAKVSLKKPLAKCRTQSIKYGIIQGVSLCLWNIAHAVALWYTTILVKRGQSSFENGIRSYQIFSLTVPSITELWTLIPTVFSAISILTPAFHTLDRQTEIEPDEPKQPPRKSIKGDIEFSNVSFTYPSRPDMIILDNFNLTIEAGSKVALVGPSGAGKSSILALLLRFYDVNEGALLIDWKNVKSYNLKVLRAQIGLVQQEPLLFSFSIRENICYGNEVGEKGCQLSGGQKQRIAIARVLLKKPAIMLLDEATSALDAESERAIINALESLQQSTTNITVAHRLSTVINSDTIFVMDKGKVVEMGTHANLVTASEGVYSKLYTHQSFAGN